MLQKGKEKTIVHFISIRNRNSKLNKYFQSVQFGSRKIQTNFNDLNDIELNLELEEENNNFYFNELIDFYKEDDTLFPDISFVYSIYKRKINNIYIDFFTNIKINDTNNSLNNVDTSHSRGSFINNKKEKKENKIFISLEIIFQTIKKELLPKKIIYDGKELSFFDTFQNQLRKRIGLVNINPYKIAFINDILEKYPNFEFVDQASYQLLTRIPIEGNIEYSIANNRININRLKHETNSIKMKKDDSFKILFNFKENFFTFIKNIENDIDENKLMELYEQSKSLLIEKYYYENALYYNDFELIDLDIFNLIFYYYEFLEIININNDQTKKGSLLGKLLEIIDFNKKYEENISQVKELNINLKDKILIIKAYNTKFIKSFETGYNINFISVVNLEKESNINPYCKAVNFIRKLY